MRYPLVIVCVLAPLFVGMAARQEPQQGPSEEGIRQAPREWRTECKAYPVMIPHEPNGPVLMTSVPKVRFDIDGDGQQGLVTWPLEPANLAFLAMDKNGNGLIDDGRELFSEHTTPGSVMGSVPTSDSSSRSRCLRPRMFRRSCFRRCSSGMIAIGMG